MSADYNSNVAYRLSRDQRFMLDTIATRQGVAANEWARGALLDMLTVTFNSMMQPARKASTPEPVAYMCGEPGTLGQVLDPNLARGCHD
jgi:hypothetical protein